MSIELKLCRLVSSCTILCIYQLSACMRIRIVCTLCRTEVHYTHIMTIHRVVRFSQFNLIIFFLVRKSSVLKTISKHPVPIKQIKIWSSSTQLKFMSDLSRKASQIEYKIVRSKTLYSLIHIGMPYVHNHTKLKLLFFFYSFTYTFIKIETNTNKTTKNNTKLRNERRNTKKKLQLLENWRRLCDDAISFSYGLFYM